MGQTALTPTVLVIDDDLNLLPFLVDMLSVMTSYRIVTARDGVEGLIAYAEHHPQCVIVDMKMPELDGAQFVRALRGDPATLNTPIIMLTAMGRPTDHVFGLAAGVDHYLVKPVEPEVLVEAIERALAIDDAERRRRLHELAEGADSLDRLDAADTLEYAGDDSTACDQTQVGGGQ
jgi:CheY-like chemotaxis protein